jgi:hypothetical protein
MSMSIVTSKLQRANVFLLAMGGAALCMPILGFDLMPFSLRAIFVLLFLSAAAGLSFKKKWGRLLASIALWLLLLWGALTITPDWDDATLKGESSSSAAMIARISVIAIYCVGMLWSLRKRRPGVI